jgi:hypothetical protein
MSTVAADARSRRRKEADPSNGRPSRPPPHVGGYKANKKPAPVSGAGLSIQCELAFRQQLRRAFGGRIRLLRGAASRLRAFAGFSCFRAFSGFGYLGRLVARGGAVLAFARLQRGNRRERSNGQTEDEFFHTYLPVR